MTSFKKAQLAFTVAEIFQLAVFVFLSGSTTTFLTFGTAVLAILLAKLILLMATGPDRGAHYLYSALDLPFLAFLTLYQAGFHLYFFVLFIILSGTRLDSRATVNVTAMSLLVYIAAAMPAQKGQAYGLWAALPPGAAVIALAGFFIFLLAKTHEADRSEDSNRIRELQESGSILASEKAEAEEELKSLRANQEKMSKTVAELFTLQTVGDTVNSTLELGRLLHVVNDVIVGIMGVNTCSICIFDENPGGVRYFVTNEKNQAAAGKIKARALQYPAGDQGGEEALVQQVSGLDPVTRITFTPVIKNNHIMGVIITGHTENNLFNREDIRFLKSICNQISLAIENAMLYEKLNKLANTDGLTGLYNRSFFQKNFDSIISGLPDKNMVAVAMMDIDDFKKINDRYGHDAGDRVLVGLSDVVISMIRKDDIFVRYGGEEFVLIMQNITREKSLERLNQIREAIKNSTFDHGGNRLSITVSIGVSYLEKDGDTREDLIKKADLALYIAKKNGKDRMEVYN